MINEAAFLKAKAYVLAYPKCISFPYPQIIEFYPESRNPLKNIKS